MSREPPPVRRAAVVGAGTMGTGIAQVVAAAGVEVALVDTDPPALERASKRLTALLSRMPEAGALSTHRSVDGAAGAGAAIEIAIEAVPESLELKREVFASLSSALGPEALLATNTSSLLVRDIAEAAEGPERVVGMHFMNPAPVMKLVEVVRAERTSDETVAAATAFVERLGKAPVVVADTPCFVVNRVLIPMINEAARALEEGAATPESIDACMKLGARFPMGPLHLADLIGLDVVVEELRVLERSLGGRYAPSKELTTRLEQGNLGRKTGRGFFTYRV